MTPDPPTLLGFTATIFLLLGLHFIVSEPDDKTWSRALCLAAPFLLGSLSGLFFAAPELLPGLWGLRTGALFMVLSYGAAWQALRMVLGYRPLAFGFLVPCGISFILSILGGPSGLIHAMSTSWRLGTIAAFNACGARDLKKSVIETTPAGRSLWKVLVLYAVFHALLIPFIYWLPAPLGGAPSTVWAIVAYTCLSVIEVTLFAMALIAIPREQLAYRHQKLLLQDPLSGAGNRRAFEAWSGSGDKVWRRKALLLLDIDHFKSINDAYGHATGDQIIVAAGRVCAELLKPPATFFRIGGDEFVVVFPCESLSAMLATANALKDAFSIETRMIGSHEVKATLSMGAALSPAPDFPPAELLAQADAALYAAKHSGRDRVVVHGAGEDLSRSPTSSLYPTGRT